MPTTLTGLLLFVLLMLPGFAYLVGKERAGTERRSSPFRETVAVIAASIVAELVTTLLVAPIWTRHVEFVRVVREPGPYLRERPVLIIGWVIGLLIGATVLAHLATWPSIRSAHYQLLPERLRDKPQNKHRFSYPHPSAVSAWWYLLAQEESERRRYVALVLDDEDYVAGWLVSFNNDAADSPDRDIVLGPPIQYRERGAIEVTEDYPVSAVCVSARRIVTMFVTYEAPSPSATSSQVVAAEESGGAE